MHDLLKIVLLILLPVPLLASEEAVLAVLQPVADATVRGDMAAGVDVMYEPAIKELGGKKKLLEAVEVVQKQLTAQKMKIVRFDLVQPVRFVKTDKRQYAIVSTVTDITFSDGVIRAHGFQFGIEVEPGKWQFLDGARTTMDVVRKYFPDYPNSEKLPERRREILKP